MQHTATRSHRGHKDGHHTALYKGVPESVTHHVRTTSQCTLWQRDLGSARFFDLFVCYNMRASFAEERIRVGYTPRSLLKMKISPIFRSIFCPIFGCLFCKRDLLMQGSYQSFNPKAPAGWRASPCFSLRSCCFLHCHLSCLLFFIPPTHCNTLQHTAAAAKMRRRVLLLRQPPFAICATSLYAPCYLCHTPLSLCSASLLCPSVVPPYFVTL